MKPVSVLVADNSHEFTNFLCQYLSLNPDIRIVGIAGDGAETVELLEKTRPDVLLLDLVMPDVDGFEVLRRIAKYENRPKVFVISALGSEDITGQAKKLGADFCFVKPFNIKKVAAKILETRKLQILK